MKFWEVFRFELRYQFGRVWTWLFFLVLLVISFMITRDGTFAEALHDDFLLNSPFAIAKTTVVGCLLWLWIAGAIAGEAAARDVATGMYSLVYTTPLTKTGYLAGRFLAALFLNLFILLSVQLSIVLAVYLPGVDKELIGPFRALAYLTSYGYIVVPNTILATAVQFMFALRAGRPMAAYLGSFLVFFMSYIFASFMFIQGRRDLANLLDPIGVHFVLSEYSHMWTTVEKSWRLLALEGTLLMNRLLWSSVALAALAITYLGFRFSHRTTQPWLRLLFRKRVQTGPQPTPLHPYREFTAPRARVQRTFDPATRISQIFAITGKSFRTTALSWAGLFMLLVIPLLSVFVVADQMEMNGVPLTPTTIRVISELVAPMVSETARWVIIPLLIIIFVGELLWRERNNGMGEITDATPGSDWVTLLGKFFGLVLVLFLFVTLEIIAGITAQLALHYQDIDIWLYATIMYGLQLPEYILFLSFAMVIHVVVDQKYVGHLAVIVAYTMIAIAPMFGIEHNLLIYGASPSWSYTEMRGFGSSLGPWLWFKIYWFGWALIFAVVSRLFWMRGVEKGFNIRLQIARSRFAGTAVWVAGTGLLVIVGVGAFIFYNTNILNEYQTSAETKKKSADYELRFGRYRNTPQPELTHAALEIEIYPSQKAVDIKGVYHFVNRTTNSIDSIHVVTPQTIRSGDIRFFFTPATKVVEDPQFGYSIFSLESPLRPGDSLQMDFQIHVQPRGFTESGADNSVLPNGTYFMIQNWLPAVGYQKSRELMSAADRREYRLVARPLIPSLYDAESTTSRTSGVHFEAIIGTDEGQVAVAPGNLRRDWKKGNRHYFDYSTDGPIGHEWAIASAKYSVREFKWDNPTSDKQTAVKIFHHPSHTGNIDRIAAAVRASLDYYTQQFGPYRHNHLSVVEYPGNGTGMHAEPTMITHQEGFTQWAPAEGSSGPDLPYAVVAHEMGHQWGVPLAFVEGAPVVAEGVAWYYGMKLVETARGDEELQRLRSFMQEPYPYPPIRRGEPLLRGLDPYLSYRRCPFALYALNKYIGEQKVNQALRQMREKHLPEDATLATTLDLYHELQAVTPDSMQYLLHDLFEVNTYWQLQTKRASAKKIPAGGWELTIDLQSRKLTYDSSGVNSEVRMNDWIEVGVFGEDGKRNPIHLQPYRIQSGKQQITLNVMREPTRVEIDPNRLLIDLEPDNNIVDVRLE